MLNTKNPATCKLNLFDPFFILNLQEQCFPLENLMINAWNKQMDIYGV